MDTTLNPVILIDKKVGQTPLEAIREFQSTHSEYQTQKMAYAGRLDPMASGLLLVLVDKECKRRKDYERLPKTYEFEILFGASTDTYDILGLIQGLTLQAPLFSNINSVNRGSTPTELKKNQKEKGRTPLSLENISELQGQTLQSPQLQKNLNPIFTSLVGKHMQPYPPYSAARVNGKPLYYWARENLLDTIQIPKKEIEIFDLKLLRIRTVSKQELKKNIFKRIKLVSGNFRQEEILQSWTDFFKDQPDDQTYQVSQCVTDCSSGTYVRALVHEIAQKLQIPALTYSIKRTKVGIHHLNA